MCLAIPVKIVSINGEEAEVESGGIKYQANICLTPGVKIGDYVLLHTGYAISIIDKEEAQKTLAMLQEMEVLAIDE